MSSRIKERGGGGGKIMASNPQKTLALTDNNTPKPKSINRRASTAAAASWKENPSTGRAAARRSTPVIPSVRWSTSSIPRGKSPNPPDLNIRASAALKHKDLGARVRVGVSKDDKVAKLMPNLKRIGGIDQKEIKRNKENELKKSVDGAVNIFDKSSNSNPRVRVSESEKDAKFKPTSSKSSSSLDVSLVKISHKDHFSEELISKSTLGISNEINKGVLLKKCVNVGVKSKEIGNSSEVEAKDSDCIKVFENPKSKLHDKLAALEGRVQRIASDIKRTKEMLDLNNHQTESKLILSDIQKKISGIEKAVGCVMDGDGNELGLSEVIKDHKLQAENINGPVKGLKLEELEARFFPHQKLIKNRTSLDSKPELTKPKGSMSPIDENPIALEFLASLDTDQHDMKKPSRAIKSELVGVQKMGMEGTTSGDSYGLSQAVSLQCNEEITLMANEKLDDFDDQENNQAMVVFEEVEDSCKTQMYEVGRKTSTGGWFVSEGEAVLLTHSDGSCSYYDIANSEEKAEYKPPQGVSSNLWRDCWLIRATGTDGSSGRFIVAASAGSTLESGFCSWDFYTKSIQSFRVEDGTPSSFSMASSRTALALLTNTGLLRRSVSCTMPAVESRQWWYKPCGPLLISTASRQKNVSAYDIRDGEVVLKWEVNSPVLEMEYASPLQWRSRGKVVVAQNEAISLWDVNSLTPQPLLSVSSCGKKICCLHVNNTDAEIGGGVRQRARSSEVEGNDGVFCSQDSINVFDFRIPSGVGLKISRHGANSQSIFSCGNYIFVGSTDTRLPLKRGSHSRLQQFSLRTGKLMATYALPDSNSHFHHSSITQVWGNSSIVMGISGMGLSVFDASEDESMHSFNTICGNTVEVKETIGPDDLYCPTFDYLGLRVLVISRDRPAMWRYLL